MRLFTKNKHVATLFLGVALFVFVAVFSPKVVSADILSCDPLIISTEEEYILNEHVLRGYYLGFDCDGVDTGIDSDQLQVKLSVPDVRPTVNYLQDTFEFLSGEFLALDYVSKLIYIAEDDYDNVVLSVEQRIDASWQPVNDLTLDSLPTQDINTLRSEGDVPPLSDFEGQVADNAEETQSVPDDDESSECSINLVEVDDDLGDYQFSMQGCGEEISDILERSDTDNVVLVGANFTEAIGNSGTLDIINPNRADNHTTEVFSLADGLEPEDIGQVFFGDLDDPSIFSSTAFSVDISSVEDAEITVRPSNASNNLQPTAAGSCDVGNCQDIRVDFTCQRQHLFDSNATCCVQYCADAGALSPNTTEELINLNFFGVSLRLNSNQAIAQLIFLGFNLFLGVAALVAIFIGFLASVQRANADSDDQVQALTKKIRNAIIGLVILGMSFLVAQLVGSLLGIGSIAQIATFTEFLPGGGAAPSL